MTRGKAGDPSWSPALLTVVARSAGKVPGDDASSQAGVRSPRSQKLLNRVLPLRPLSALPDDRLVEMTQAGNERAFETLATRYRRPLLIYAERMLGAESRAEDALQQAFLQAWIALRGGAEVAEARPWLYRIVHNCAVSTIRRARHECVELTEELDAAASDSGAEPRLVLGEIFDHLALMPEPQREAIVMTAIAGHSHEEAAAALGLTDGAVRGLVYRARSALRRAAAAIFPVGMWNWLGRRQTLGGDATDAAGVAGAAGSAGLAAAVVKGGAIVATAGVIAGAGHGLLTSTGTARHQHHQSTHRVVSARAPAPSRHVRSGPLLPAAVAASQVTVAERHGAGNHDRHTGESAEGGSRGRISGSSGGGRGRDDAEHDSGSANGGDDRGGGTGSSGSGPGTSSEGSGERSSGSGTSGRSGGDSSGGSGGDVKDGGHGSSGGPPESEAPATPPQPALSDPLATSGSSGGGSGSGDSHPNASGDGASGSSGGGGDSSNAATGGSGQDGGGSKGSSGPG